VLLEFAGGQGDGLVVAPALNDECSTGPAIAGGEERMNRQHQAGEQQEGQGRQHEPPAPGRHEQLPAANQTAEASWRRRGVHATNLRGNPPHFNAGLEGLERSPSK
jgi:hypothetical protein